MERFSEIIVDFVERRADEPRSGDGKEALRRDLADRVALDEFDLDEWAVARGIVLDPRGESDERAEAERERRDRIAAARPPVPAGRPIEEVGVAAIGEGTVVRLRGAGDFFVVTSVRRDGRFDVSSSGRILDGRAVDAGEIAGVVFPIEPAEMRARTAGLPRKAAVGVYRDEALRVQRLWRDGKAIHDIVDRLYDDLKRGPEAR